MWTEITMTDFDFAGVQIILIWVSLKGYSIKRKGGKLDPPK